MYGYHWLEENGIFKLDVNITIQKEIRPVFNEELDLFEFKRYFDYPVSDSPLLWAEGIRKYIKNGEVIATAKGGGFYSLPEIHIKGDGNLKLLTPINIDLLTKINSNLIEGLIQRAIRFIKRTHNDYVLKGYKFVVAFSGGKDSIVLLDLVQRALSPDQFIVVFSDTGMELSDTYLAVERAKDIWPNLNFQTAKSDFTAQESWREFGPPGRRLRWCCAIHKTVPTLLLLRRHFAANGLKAVIYDGIRAEESDQRSTYVEIAKGNKHINQVNCRPLLDWNSAEIYLYLLGRKLLINSAYRYGMSRVGCAVCPMSSGWRDAISKVKYPYDIKPLLSIIEEYARKNKGDKEVKSYVEKVKWGARMGGNGLDNANIRVFEEIKENTIKILIPSCKQRWIDVCKLLGPITERNNCAGEQIIEGQTYNFKIEYENGLKVTYDKFGKIDRYAISWIRGVANKVAYCVGCKTCVVECPTGAFEINENKKIIIQQDLCVHCMKCITNVVKGCWAARALVITKGGNCMNLKGMDRYSTFGLRSSFLEHFFEYGNECWNLKELGNKQYDSLRTWLKEAEIIEAGSQKNINGQISQLGSLLIKVGPYNSFVWSAIWTNLAYNSTLIKWYILYVPSGEIYEKQDLVSLADSLTPEAESSRKNENAMASLSELMRHSPIGNTLGLGIPLPSGNSYKFFKKGWETPDAASLLYALYRYAEKMDHHYDFTLKELDSIRQKRPENFIGMEPVSLFGLDPKNFKEIVRNLAIHYPKYINVSFDADLDNIKLFSNINSLDIVDLVLKGETR